MKIKQTTKKNIKSNPKNPDSYASKKSRKNKKPPRTKKQKIVLAVIIIILISLAIGLGVIYFLIFQDPNPIENAHVDFPDQVYSILTGEEISDASLNQSPTYCIQIPNGADGARPQAGLVQAGVVFEAIAERGITRFAAIFQNPTASAIGPIRSLRPYYLDWDTPFDCTIVHAGGSAEALAALRAGGQRNLDESLQYMWRERSGTRAWNNLFTSSSKLAEFNNANGFTSSVVKAFSRLTPDETEAILSTKQTCPEDAEDCEITYVSPAIKFGASLHYNTYYTYNPETNSYARFYATGNPHVVYDCAPQLSDVNTTSDCGEPVQLMPKVVIAMIVHEGQMSDGYHEDIKTISSGTALVFQNGGVIEGTWSKSAQNAQIVFKDSSGAEIKLAPGQTWISAVPQYGSVDY